MKGLPPFTAAAILFALVIASRSSSSSAVATVSTILSDESSTYMVQEVQSTVYSQIENYEDMHRWKFDWFFSPTIPEFPTNAAVIEASQGGMSRSSSPKLKNCSVTDHTFAGPSYLIQFASTQETSNSIPIAGRKKHHHQQHQLTTGTCLVNFNTMTESWSPFNSSSNPEAICFQATFSGGGRGGGDRSSHSGSSRRRSRAKGENTALVVLCCDPTVSTPGVKPLGHAETVQTSEGYDWTIFLASSAIRGCRQDLKP